LILANVNYVKKIIFPLELLPWVAFGSALFHAAISLCVLLAAQVMIRQELPWTIVFFPIVLMPLALATLGIAWFLAALGVYVRDVVQVTSVLTTILLFISPVLYPVSSLPVEYHIWLHLNPLTFIIEEGRNSLIFGKAPDTGRWTIMLTAGLVIAWAGFAWFQKTRKGFADVV
jgi:lipopolysaccharide transport system permease protein